MGAVQKDQVKPGTPFFKLCQPICENKTCQTKKIHLKDIKISAFGVINLKVSNGDNYSYFDGNFWNQHNTQLKLEPSHTWDSNEYLCKIN